MSQISIFHDHLEWSFLQCSIFERTDDLRAISTYDVSVSDQSLYDSYIVWDTAKLSYVLRFLLLPRSICWDRRISADDNSFSSFGTEILTKTRSELLTENLLTTDNVWRDTRRAMGSSSALRKYEIFTLDNDNVSQVMNTVSSSYRKVMNSIKKYSTTP